jgi:dipeptidyl-peptidase-4
MKKNYLNFRLFVIIVCLGLISVYPVSSQEVQDSSLLTIDRIFNSAEFRMGRFGPARWIDNGEAYIINERSAAMQGGQDIVKYMTMSGEKSIQVAAADLIPKGAEAPLDIEDFSWSNDKQKLLIFTNSQRVWRQNTRGDYWIFDIKTKELNQLGKGLPESSLMFAKFSPDDLNVAYVSKHNLYVENINDQKITQLTFDGTETFINGTFDWAYEEEFDCRDGFAWSPDGKKIAYWQLDASKIRNFLMINNTDSIYSYVIPVQYPKVGCLPSSCRIGIIAANGGPTVWMNIPGDTREHYLPRLMWNPGSSYILVQQLNYKQNTLWLWHCEASDGKTTNIYTETDPAWIDVVDDWQWLEGGNEFFWKSEKDGWLHFYRITSDGVSQKVITDGEYDAIRLAGIDQAEKECYFIASPDNPTQRYLYRISMEGKGKMERLSPSDKQGTHNYDISPDAKYAFHNYSNLNTPPVTELVSLPDHKVIRILNDNASFKKVFAKLKQPTSELFRVTTEDGVQMDGWIMKPPDFDPAKKYPVLFYLYGEPAGQTATDAWQRSLWNVMLVQKGYLIMTVDNRGTPCPRGREWRKSIYQKIGVLNSHDQAMAAKEILKWEFVDPDRIAVWGMEWWWLYDP